MKNENPQRLLDALAQARHGVGGLDDFRGQLLG
jgi:hypothetical protein